MCGRDGGAPPESSAIRTALGPNRVPGRCDTVSSMGAPTMATSTPSSSPGSSTRGSLQNVPRPANPGSPVRLTRIRLLLGLPAATLQGVATQARQEDRLEGLREQPVERRRDRLHELAGGPLRLLA